MASCLCLMPAGMIPREATTRFVFGQPMEEERIPRQFLSETRGAGLGLLWLDRVDHPWHLELQRASSEHPPAFLDAMSHWRTGHPARDCQKSTCSLA